MSSSLPADLLTRPAVEATRLIALGFLDEAAAAATRLGGGDRADPEALHDFRVALRRLRSTLRSYRDAGLRVPKRDRRVMRRIARRTNAGRDAEVQLAWLGKQAAGLSPRERVGLRWLTERLGERLQSEFADTVAAVRSGIPKVDRKLRRRLEHYRPRLPVGGPGEPPFGTAAREAVESAAGRLASALQEVHTAADDAEAHAARIAAKRLRYTLEPLVAWLKEGHELVRLLKALQDGLGELHDCHTMERELATAAADAGAARARQIHEASVANGGDAARRLSHTRDARAGLAALGRLVRADRDRAFEKVAGEWLGDRGTGFVTRVEGAAASLERPRPATSRTTRRRGGWGRGGAARTGGRRGSGA
jgi:CHAD domain-containing protein